MRTVTRLAAAIVLGLLCSSVARASEETGFEARRPVVAAACSTCPWGAIADVLKAIMRPRGYELQICYTCSRMDNMRLVASGDVPPPRRSDQSERPVPPAGPIDFGVTNLHLLSQAYNGTSAFAGEGPRGNLRAIGVIEHPMFVLVAARRGSFITDLAQVVERKLPVRILADNHPLTNIVLEHYGLTRDAVEGWGGEILSAGEALPDGDGGSDIFGREVDIIVHNQTYLANTPEARLWYHYSQHQSLRYLPLDQPLLERMQSEFQLERVSVPEGLLRGLEQPFETVARSGQVVYGRDDMPEPFAYLLAQAMDEESRRFIWTMMPLSYNQRTAAQTLDVPLHPGAARYYRERGYPTQP